MLNTTQTALEFAIASHGDQMYGKHPYVYHLVMVVGVLVDAGREDLSDAGYLHDVLEDTPVTYQELETLFPQSARIVLACSGFGYNRRARQADIKSKMIGFPDAQTVKAADRVANMRHSQSTNPGLFTMYLKERESFLASIPEAEKSLREIIQSFQSERT